MLLADDLPIEERCQRRVFLRKTSDLQVAAQVGIVGVNMLRQKQFAYCHQSKSVFAGPLITVRTFFSGNLTPIQSDPQVLLKI